MSIPFSKYFCTGTGGAAGRGRGSGLHTGHSFSPWAVLQIRDKDDNFPAGRKCTAAAVSGGSGKTAGDILC